ncbi:fimbrial protein [Klebsiella spallanzanii]|uniref:fimbrial protein n=1 Tax=Klebsiella spallanzanii TaxID=2587528 RepID=UPI0011586C41|nr:fimbrial protein [Klebsiella spallanzanii]VUS96387.1 hypothetical protein SB6419_01525 [Klebsiella spallanzanii]
MKIKDKALTTGALIFLLSSLAQASDGTMAIVGKITDNTCAVLGASEENGTPSPNLTLTMHRDVSTAAIPNSGNWGENYKYFDIHFSCSSGMVGRNIQIKFSANEYDTYTLLNTDKTGPSNIGFQIRNLHTYGLENFNSSTPATTYPVLDQDFLLRYEVAYTKLNNDPIIAGPILSTVYYDVTYL